MFVLKFLVLASGSWHKGSIYLPPRICCWMKKGWSQATGWDQCFFSFSALTLLVAWHEGHLARENILCHLSMEVLFWNSWWKETEGEPPNGGPLKQVVVCAEVDSCSLYCQPDIYRIWVICASYCMCVCVCGCLSVCVFRWRNWRRKILSLENELHFLRSCWTSRNKMDNFSAELWTM